MIKFIIAVLFMVLNWTSFAEEEKQQYNFFKGQKTYIKNPFELRDPFKRPNFKKKRLAKERYGGRVIGDKFTNLPSIESLKIDKIRIVGIVLGKNRRAVAKVGNDTYVLKEGMTLGENQAELKAILPGGIVLVEKFKNVYDQDEFLETIIPVSVE